MNISHFAGRFGNGVRAPGNVRLDNFFNPLPKFISKIDGQVVNNVNFEIRVDTNFGKLWFGDGRKQLKLACLDLFDIAKKSNGYDDGFTFCCSLYENYDSVTIVSFEKL